MTKTLLTTKEKFIQGFGKFWLILAVFAVSVNILLPNYFVQAAYAQTDEVMLVSVNDGYPASIMPEIAVKKASLATLPSASNKQAKVRRSNWVYTGPKTLQVTSTAYTSEVGQCDATPFITASGYDLSNSEETVVAANFLPLGAKIKIPDMFGDRVFTVEDRMNARYNLRVDVWMKSKADALQYGRRTVTIEVLD